MTTREPGAFWLINGRRYVIDPAGRYVDLESVEPSAMSLDDKPGIELELNPAQVASAAPDQGAVEWALSCVLARYSYGDAEWTHLDPEERNAIAEPYLPRAREMAPMVAAALTTALGGEAAGLRAAVVNNGDVWSEHGHPRVPCSPPEAVRGSTPCRLAATQAGDPT